MKKIKRLLTIGIAVLLMLCMSVSLSACKNEAQITYQLQLSVRGYATENEQVDANLTEENPTYDYQMELSNYFICCPTLEVYKLINGEAVSGQPVYKADVWQMQTDFGVSCAYYGLKKNGEEKAYVVPFSGLDYHIQSHLQGYFKIYREVGSHCISFYIPAMEQYGTKATTFTLNFNISPDSREKTTKIILSQQINEGVIKYDGIDGEYDLYIMDKQPIFTVENAENIPFDYGGNLFVSYRMLNKDFESENIQYSMDKKGLYLCNVDFLNHEEYQSTFYRCYILYE